MAWSTPDVYVVGQVLTATSMNKLGSDVLYLYTQGRVLLAYGTKSSNVATTGTTFAAGADLLTAALSFTADGISDYVISVWATLWDNTSTASNTLALNFDSADQGTFGQTAFLADGNNAGIAFATIAATPSAGAHTVNVRLYATAGTATVYGGAGGAGTRRPIIVMVEKA